MVADNDITLKELIFEAFIKGSVKLVKARNRKEKVEQAENLNNWFGKYYTDQEEQRDYRALNITLAYIRKNPDKFTVYIVEGLKKYTRDKYLQAVKIIHFLQYINEKYGTSCDVSQLEKFKQLDKKLRQLEILKHLHSEEFSADDIAEDFEISERALREDLRELTAGIEFMGTEMKINESHHKDKQYSSPIHPVFLALNSAEIYAMTIGLKLLSKDTVFQHTLSRVADNVYNQLSEFASKLINSQPEINEIEFEIEPGGKRKFLSSLDMKMCQEFPFCQYLKSKIPCNITYEAMEGRKSITGTIHLPVKSENRFGSITVKDASGDQIIAINDIVAIKEIISDK